MQEAKPAADMSGGNLSGDTKHRRVTSIRGGKRRRRIENARSGYDEAGTDTPSHLRIAESHVRGRLLVPRMNDADRILPGVERVENVIELNAGQAEDRVDAFGCQSINENLGAGCAGLVDSADFGDVHGRNLTVDAAASNAVRWPTYASTSW